MTMVRASGFQGFAMLRAKWPTMSGDQHLMHLPCQDADCRVQFVHRKTVNYYKSKWNVFAQ